MKELDPYRILEVSDLDDWPEGYDPFERILSNFNPADLPKLARILRSSDHLVSRRALCCFGELGHKAFPVVDDALRSVNHPDSMARKSLVDGLLCYSRQLTGTQLAKVLSIQEVAGALDKPEGLVRGNLVVIIGSAGPVKTRAAIEEIADVQLRSRHLAAYQQVHKSVEDVQSAFDEACGHAGIEAVYALANLVWTSENGTIDKIPSYDGDYSVFETVKRQLQRRLDTQFRAQNPRAWLDGLKQNRRSSTINNEVP